VELLTYGESQRLPLDSKLVFNSWSDELTWLFQLL